MSSEATDDQAPEPNVTDAEEDTDAALADLRTRVELLREENRRLRAESQRLTQARYRQTALGLLGVGLVAALGGLVFPAVRSVLIVLAGIGAFGAVLTYYLTPERFIAASVGERVYATHASNGDQLIEEFGLTDHRVYVPTEGGSVRLFIPQHEEFEVPAGAALDRVAVVPDERGQRGVAIEPTGNRLYGAFEGTQAVTGDGAADLTAALADAAVEQFELAASVTTDVDVDTGAGRVTVGVNGSALGPVTRFDHPIASFVAAGLAVELDQPIKLAVTDSSGGRDEASVTCRWVANDEDTLADLPKS